MSAGTWAVVVARTGPTAKSRLAPVLGPDERAALARAMLADVLAACRAAEFDGVVAVVSTADGRRVAEERGAHVRADGGRDMNAAVAAGLRVAADAGAAAALVLPGDLPLARAEDLRAVVAAGAGNTAAVVVVPDRAGTGTNALLLRPPSIVAPRFGPRSAARHTDAGERAGARVTRRAVPRLGLDVDTPRDLGALRGARTGTATAAVLARLGPPALLPHGAAT